MAESQSLWKKADSNTNKEDCVNCYADLDFDKKIPKVVKDRKEIVYAFNDTNSKSKTYSNNGYKYKIAKSDTHPKALEFKDKVYVEKKSKSNVENTVAIQVGAFRYYRGAKKYVKKYAILSSKYKVTIKTGAKDQKPLYRVQIEGFSSRSKAKEFKKKYGLVGAFLVMK
jgi:cell division septation protein DedD